MRCEKKPAVLTVIPALTDVLWGLLYTALCCSVYFMDENYYLIIPPVLLAMLVNVASGVGTYGGIPTVSLKICRHGVSALTAFFVSASLSAGFHVWLGFRLLPDGYVTFIVSCAVFISLSAMLFWNGAVSVYLTSVQLGVKYRVLGIVFFLIPPLNIIMLYIIIRRSSGEVRAETERYILDRSRAGLRVCATKYPVLLVHGVFFRDFKYLSYWGRIPDALTANGAQVYTGDHSSARAVADSAAELTERIKQIVRDTGCGKVNVIAHSKGGLDMRYAIDNGAAPYVASLTTVSTPHRGCAFADVLLEKIPEKVKLRIERTYNKAARRLGDKDPDFMAAVRDLTASSCSVFDRAHPVPDGIPVMSIGSEQKGALAGTFPVSLTYHLVRRFSGKNDGLVSFDSFRFGENYEYITPKHSRGISHMDMTDMTRENIPDFDVREYYVRLVSSLKEKGL